MTPMRRLRRSLHRICSPAVEPPRVWATHLFADGMSKEMEFQPESPSSLTTLQLHKSARASRGYVCE